MAQLARLIWTVADPTTGLPVSGASVEVRKQGATVDGLHSGATTSFTVNDPGAIAVSDLVQAVIGGLTRSVSSLTATNVTVGGPGFADLADDTRLFVSSPLPTLFNDAQGAETIANPLTTDANGLVKCWIVGGKYDLLVSAAGVLATTLYEDVATTGGEQHQSTVFNSGTIPAWVFDSLRELVATQPIASFRRATVDRFRIFGDGSWRSVAGGTIDAGGLVVTAGDLTFGAAASQIIPGATSLALRNTADSADNMLISDAGAVTFRGALSGITTINAAGNLPTRRLEMNQGTMLAPGDFSLSAGWGTTASVSSVLGNPTDSGGTVRITSAGTGQGANPTVTFTYPDGARPAATNVVLVTRERTLSADQIGVAFHVSAQTATAVTFTFNGTPVDTEVYGFTFVAFGGKP